MINLLLCLLATAPLDDEVLVTTFQPAFVQRFDAVSGAHLLEYGASPLAGALGLTVGPDGLVYVASEGTDEVLRFRPEDGTFVDAFVTDDPATPGIDETGGLDGPTEVVFDDAGRLYVASFNTDAVLRYDGSSGAFDQVFVQPASGGLNGPDLGTTFGPDGHLYVPSYWNHRVKRYDGTAGAFLGDAFTSSQSGLLNPRAVLFIPGGTALVASEGSDQVLAFDAASGAFLAVLVGDDPSTPAVDESGGLSVPVGMDRGPGNELLVVSLGSDAVKRYDLASGAYLGDLVVAVPHAPALPTGLLVRPVTSSPCDGALNSSGREARLAALGSTSVSGPGLRLRLSGAPAGQIAVLFAGAGGAPATHGDGTLCLQGHLERVIVGQTNGAGHALFEFPASALPVVLGLPIAMQGLYADPLAGGAGYSTSSSLVLTLIP